MIAYQYCYVHPGSGDATQPLAQMTYLAYVAYPHSNDRSKRVRFVKIVAAMHFKNQGITPPENLRGFKAERVQGIIDSGLRRINSRRIPAALMAARKMGFDTATGAISLRAASRLYADKLDAKELDAREATPDNVRKRIWRDSLPALAMSWPLMILLAKGERVRSLLHRDDWVADAISEAYEIAPMLEETLTLKRILLPVCEMRPVLDPMGSSSAR